MSKFTVAFLVMHYSAILTTKHILPWPKQPRVSVNATEHTGLPPHPDCDAPIVGTIYAQVPHGGKIWDINVRYKPAEYEKIEMLGMANRREDAMAGMNHEVREKVGIHAQTTGEAIIPNVDEEVVSYMCMTEWNGTWQRVWFWWEVVPVVVEL